jgi:hypothetical protein
LAAAAGREISSELLTAATEAARTAVSLASTDSNILDTLAHLLARGGRLDEAIEVQRLALEHAGNEIREPIQRFLTELELKARIHDGSLSAIEPDQAASHPREWVVVTIPTIKGRWLAEAGPCVLAAAGGDSSQAVAVVIPPQGLASLEAADVFDPALAYAGKTLRVAGQVQIENGPPQIEVLTAEQITVVADEPADTETAAVTSEGSTSLLDGAWRKVVPFGQPRDERGSLAYQQPINAQELCATGFCRQSFALVCEDGHEQAVGTVRRHDSPNGPWKSHS